MAEFVDDIPIQGSVEAEDRISDLPDCLIHSILSLLEMKDVIKTSMLSRRWRFLWTTVPVLDFGEICCGDARLIDLSLMNYEGRKIRTFSARLHRCCKLDKYHLDSWIRFAIRRDVEEIDLQLYHLFPDKEGNRRRYSLPRIVRDCPALKVLRLGFCDLDLHASSCFHSLTTLHLYDMGLHDLDTSALPLLEYLIMEGCSACLNIYAPNRKLRSLKIKDYNHIYQNWGLTLYAPYLLSIEFHLGFRQFYSIKSLSSIISASLYIFDIEDDRGYSCFTRPLLELLRNLRRAKTLKLSQWCIKVLAYTERNKLKMPLLSAKCLGLNTNVNNFELSGMATLLKSSNCLESLSINITNDVFPSPLVVRILDEFRLGDINSWELLELALSASMQLKTVTIHHFLGNDLIQLLGKPISSLDMDKFLENSEEEVKLVKFLLKGCMILNRMIIGTIYKYPRSLKSELLHILKEKLLAFPRAAVNAEISLY